MTSESNEKVLMTKESNHHINIPTVAKPSDKIDVIWNDLKDSSKISVKAVARTAKLLIGMKSGGKTGANQNSRKRKLKEFSIPILGVQHTKHRGDIATAAMASNVKVDRVVEFAGNTFSVSTSAAISQKLDSNKKKLKTSTGKIDNVLASLEDPKKLSTMEKSTMDWEKFKADEKIADELALKAKDGYLEKQDFLQRLDEKRFEIEKADRELQRKILKQQEQSK